MGQGGTNTNNQEGSKLKETPRLTEVKKSIVKKPEVKKEEVIKPNPVLVLEKEISAESFARRLKFSSRDMYVVKKKYSGKTKPAKDWEKILKTDGLI